MKKILLFPILFLSLAAAALAAGEGTYGNETYGNASYGVSSAAEAISSETVVVDANQTTTFDFSNVTDTTLDIVTTVNTSGLVTVVKYTELPSNVGTAPATSLNKIIDIAVDDSISDNLDHSVITLKYSDSEVSNANLQEASMRLYKWNGSAWVIFDGEGIGGVNTANKNVFANTSSFSTWAVFGTAVSSPTPVVATAGSSGGGGGGGCAYDWKCTDWSTCSANGLQGRTCRNVGTCSGTSSKPEDLRSCTVAEVAEEEPTPVREEVKEEKEEPAPEVVAAPPEEPDPEQVSAFGGITGAIIGVTDADPATSGSVVIVILIIVGLVVFVKFYGGLPTADHASRAVQFHKKAEEAFKKGKHKKAEKLYKKAQQIREKGERKRFT